MEEKSRRQVIADNITYYRKLNNLTQKELAEALGLKPSTLTEYMKLRSAPSYGVIQKLADYFGVKKSDIDTTFKTNSESPPKKQERFKELTDLYKQLTSNRRKQASIDFIINQLNEQRIERDYKIEKTQDLYRALLFADRDADFEEISIFANAAAGLQGIDVHSEPIEKVLVKRPTPVHDLAFRVAGNSMEPSFYDGEVVYINTLTPVRNDDIGVFKVNDKYFLKKLHITDKINLIPLNRDYDVIIPEDDDNFKIIGKVVR